VPLNLAAFGKHPGWDDHVPVIGIETKGLARLKQTLYVDGIGGQIDSGAWERLDTEKRLGEFDHTFLWLRAGQLTRGQLWSSTDGKGRSKYPMVLGVESAGQAPAFLLSMVQPELLRLRAACLATRSAAEVTSACQAAQARLQSMTASPADQRSDLQPPTETRQRFLDRRELGPDRVGFLRILHELSRSLGAVILNPSARATATQHLRACHVRLPLAGESLDEALALWTAFLRCVIPESQPLLFLARAGADWLDLIVGEPTTDDFFCLQASPKAMPLATEIPYQMPPELAPRLQEIEARFLGARKPATLGPEASASRPAPAPSMASSTDQAKPPTPPRRKLALPIGVGAVVVIALGGLFLQSAMRDSRRASSPGPIALADTDKRYQAAMNAAETALKNRDSARARTRMNEALALKPNDPGAKALAAEVEKQEGAATAAAALDQKFAAAMAAAREAFAKTNCVVALAKVDEALALKPNDSGAKALAIEVQKREGSATAAAAVQQKYAAATNAAGQALRQGDIAGADAKVKEALALKPNDAGAKAMATEVESRGKAALEAAELERRFAAATNEVGVALGKGDFAAARARMNEALEMKPNAPEARLLAAELERREKVAAEVAELEQKFAAAMAAAREALGKTNYVAALAKVGEALKLKSDDAGAKALKAEADKLQRAAVAATELERRYVAATNEVGVALKKRDFAAAQAKMNEALALKPNDPGARALQEEVNKDQQAATGGTAPTELAKLDRNLAALQIWFGVRDAESGISKKEGTLNRLQKREWQKKVQDLRDDYKKLGSLDSGREEKLRKVSDAIEDWPLS
jgi:Tfp pilus assembly protein PilF